MALARYGRILNITFIHSYLVTLPCLGNINCGYFRGWKMIPRPVFKNFVLS